MFFRPNVAKLARQLDVPGLIKVLSSQDPSLRAHAVDALGRIGGLDVVAPLLGVALTDADTTVWELASLRFQRIAKLKDVLDQGFFFAKGDDESWITRFHVLRLQPLRQQWVDVDIGTVLRLGRLGLAVLSEGIRDDDWRVRESIAELLRDVGSEPNDRVTLTWYLVAVREWWRLDSLLTYAVEPLVAVLAHPSGVVRSNASRRLIRIGIPAVPALSSVILSSRSRTQMDSAIAAIEQIAIGERLKGKPDPLTPQAREAISRRRVEKWDP